MVKRKRKQKSKYSVIGVIDIGSSAMRLVIAELDASQTHGLDASWRVVDSAERPVQLGRDVFENGAIGRRTMIEAINILHSFKEMMAQYPINNVLAIGTSALREARNRETFIDRVRVQTDISVRVIEGIEANQLTYLAVQQSLRGGGPAITRSNSLIMEVGGGSTELMLLLRGKMVAAHTLPIGTIRIQQQLAENFALGGRVSRFIREQTRSMLDFIEAEIDLKRISRLVAVGGDARLAARRIGERKADGYSLIDKKDFTQFIRNLENMTVDEIVNELNINYSDAEPLLPALLVYLIFLEATSAKTIIVPSVSIREGLLLNFAAKPGALREVFHRQIIASAHSLAEHYHADLDHAENVRDFALLIFDEMLDEHGLDRHQRVMLEAAAILHDIGSYISGSSHHKHGQYIIDNSEIFGLNTREKDVLGNIVRYHRKAKPQSSHSSYSGLNREDKIVVLKLAAILRVADALDRAHNSRINKLEIERTDELFLVHAAQPGDFSLEKYSINKKSDLFEEVFGLEVVLR